MENQKEISVLNDLLHITNDRIEGFGKVDGKIWEKYPDVKDDYEHMISQTKLMKVELIDLINDKGGKAEDSSSVAGALHRTWIDIKNSFMSANVNSTLEHVVFGEKAAVEAYQNALNSGELSPESSKIVEEQYRSINDSYHQFEKMKEYKSKD
ncbi:PA2169 family four-helix-bundle protein [Chryseobacterium daeguense]|uniref:PA2169 family four-helix-bundle protein n=1 Tax=Chryseobacterium daeguense TaxID=412438 RepID=UPI00041A84B3|nr:PA2169 family four-helix-bundle protein [Chryseobacterium daeguense]